MLSFTRAVRTPSFDTPLGPPDSDHGSTLALALALNLALGLPCPCSHTSSPSSPPLPLPLSASALLSYSIYLANLVATTSDAAPVRKHLQTKHDNIQQDGQAKLPCNRCDIQIVPERKEVRK